MPHKQKHVKAKVDRRGIAQPCEWNGKLYPSIKAAAEAWFITHPGMWYRVQMGYKCDEDMQR